MVQSDYIVLALYIFGMVMIGLFYARRNADMKDMFAAGGQSPWWVAGLSGFMTMFSAGTFVVWGGIAYKFGFVAIVINLGYGVAALIVGYTVAAKWNAMALRTPAQYIELRYGASVVQLYTWIMLLLRIIGSGTALYALAVLLCALMPLPEGNLLRDPDTGNLSVFWACLIFGIIVIFYTMVGGLWAVLMTDVLQFIVLNLAVLFIIPLIVMAAGGFQGIATSLPPDFLSPTGGGYGWLFIIGWATIHIFMIGSEWAFAQRFISVPSRRDARKAAFLFGGLYLVSPILWLAPPFIYRLINPDAGAEEAYILAAQSVLPAGMVGLVIAAMFSATASMISSQLNVFAGVLSDMLTGGSKAIQSKLAGSLWVGRGFTFILGVLVVAVALGVPHLGGAERLIISSTSLLVGPLMAPSFFGLLTNRIDARAVWASVISAAVAGIIFKIGLAQGGFLTSIGGLSSLAHWAQNEGPVVDLFIGVVVPVVVLAAAYLLSPRATIGAQRVAEHSQASGATNAQTADHTPMLIVAIALGASAVVMIILAITDPSGRTALSSFAGALAVLAGSAWYAYRSKNTDTPVTVASGTGARSIDQVGDNE